MKECYVRFGDSSSRGLTLDDDGAAPAVRRGVDLVLHARCGQRAEEGVVARPLPPREAWAVKEAGYGTLPGPSIGHSRPKPRREFRREPDVESELCEKVERAQGSYPTGGREANRRYRQRTHRRPPARLSPRTVPGSRNIAGQT